LHLHGGDYFVPGRNVARGIFWRPVQGHKNCLPGVLKMHGQFILLAEILGYILAGHLVMTRLQGLRREMAFTALNLTALYLFFFYSGDSRSNPTFLAYLVLVTFQYLMLRLFGEKTGWRPWLAFFTPILALILIRHVPPSFYGSSHLPYGPLFIGISYLAFRSSHLVLEVRNGTAPLPGFLRYLGFCFFVPTMSVGPISPYGNHCRAFDAAPPLIAADRAWLRILVGFVKYKFVGNICFQLTYTNLLLDDHYHPWVDLPVAALFYYLFLYCNFSGFCDMAIGAAGLIGIPVAENFNNPFAARNVKDFWNRWHITLSQYMRDVVFTPLSKFLVRLTGPAFMDHDIALTIVVVFLLVGIWHGVGWNFVAWGAAHAFGLVVNHYYTIGLKKWLGRDGFKAYNSNPWIHAVAVVMTFCYCGACLFLFANTFPEMKQILSNLR
jgi:D-alanyl-lipoteichoic acid acyltransferase DltB (MBOAT superfamily)